MAEAAGLKISDREEYLQLVTFKIGDEEFSVPILKVQEIIRITDITRVPSAPHFVEGVINLRGKVIPIIDIRKRFGLPCLDCDGSSRIIVVDSGNKVVGLIVDSVSEVLRLPRSTVEPPPSMTGGVESEYIEGIGKLGERFVALLDVDRILTGSQMAELNAMDGALF